MSWRNDIGTQLEDMATREYILLSHYDTHANQFALINYSLVIPLAFSVSFKCDTGVIMMTKRETSKWSELFETFAYITEKLKPCLN